VGAGMSGLDRILRMSSPAAWVLFALFAITHSTLALASGGRPMSTAWGWLALAAILAAAAWSVWPGPFPMPVWWAALIVVLLMFGTTAVTWQLDPGAWPGYASWNFGAVSFVCFALSLRGRTLLGWVGLIGMTLSATVWSLIVAGDPWVGFSLSYRHLGTYLAGSLLSFGIHSAARRISEYRELERRAVADAAGLEAGRAERQSELEAVQAIAGPALQRIAAGQTAGAAEEFRRIDAQLRDRIRLMLPPLTEAIDAARRRGIDVDLFDDLGDGDGDLDAGALTAALASTAELLTNWTIDDGPATVRLAHRTDVPTLTLASSDRPPSIVRIG